MRLLIILIAFYPLILVGQIENQKGNVFEINFGAGETFHYGIAKDFYTVYDARLEPTFQEKKRGNSFQIQYFKEIKSGHSVGFNLSYSEFKFYERGNSYSWDKFVGAYELNQEFRFLGLGLVYNYSIPINRLGKLDIGIDIGSWRGVPSLVLKNIKFLFKVPGAGFKSRLNLSYSHKIFEKINLKIGGYFITSINSHLGERYYPYSYGVYLGIQYRVAKIFSRKEKNKTAMNKRF